MPWYVPPEVADAPDEAPGGFRYDAEAFYTGELAVQLLEAAPHSKGGGQATSIKCVFGAEAPGGQSIRWDEYLGLDTTNDFNRARQKAFLKAFAPGYLGSPEHARGDALDLGQLAGSWALCTVRKELDTYEGRPPRNKPRVIQFLNDLAGPVAVDPEKVKSVQVEIPQQGGGHRAPAPGARPPRAAAGAPQAPQGPAPGARPPAVPARPAPPAQSTQQQSFVAPSPRGEDSDLPY
jgi:hypothetical protein